MKIIIVFAWMALSPLAILHAQNLIYSAEEQKAWNEHQSEITAPVEFLAADALAELQADYKVKPSDVRNLRKLCQRMETHKYLHNYILESAAGRLVSKKNIETLYWDSIASVLIPENPEMAGSYTGYAVQMAGDLRLSGDTLNNLKELSLLYAQRLRKDPCSSFIKEEVDTLKAVVDKESLEKVINSVNAAEVENRCIRLWTSLESAGLTDELDKAADLYQASLYYQKEMLIRSYYIGEKSLIDANLNDLYRHKPRCIRMYEGIRQRAAVQKKHEERVGGQFSW